MPMPLPMSMPMPMAIWSRWHPPPPAFGQIWLKLFGELSPRSVAKLYSGIMCQWAVIYFSNYLLYYSAFRCHQPFLVYNAHFCSFSLHKVQCSFSFFIQLNFIFYIWRNNIFKQKYFNKNFSLKINYWLLSFLRIFSLYDLAASNVVLFNAHLGIGFYMYIYIHLSGKYFIFIEFFCTRYFRPHMHHLWRFDLQIKLKNNRGIIFI